MSTGFINDIVRLAEGSSSTVQTTYMFEIDLDLQLHNNRILHLCSWPTKEDSADDNQFHDPQQNCQDTTPSLPSSTARDEELQLTDIIFSCSWSLRRHNPSGGSVSAEVVLEKLAGINQAMIPSHQDKKKREPEFQHTSNRDGINPFCQQGDESLKRKKKKKASVHN